MNDDRRASLPLVRICLLLGLFTFLLYLPALRNGFLDYDDQQYVTENSQVAQGLTAANFKWAFGFHAGNWHPLAWLSHMLDCQIYALQPWGHHLTNVLIHVGSTMLLFLVLYRMTRAVGPSAGVAGLFGWHPLHVESVAWVAERKDVLCAFFWIATIGCYARYAEARTRRDSRVWLYYGAVLVAFALALLSKPMAVTLPAVLILLDGWPLRRWPAQARASGSKTLAALLCFEKLPLALMAAATCMLTLRAQELAIVPVAGLTVWQRMIHAAASYAHYLGAMVWPTNLAVFYPYRVALPAWQVVISILILISITVVAWVGRKQRPWLGVGWLWYLGTLVPVIGLVQVGDQAWADRYTYLPLIGVFIAVAWSFNEMAGARSTRIAVVALVMAGLALTTTLQLRHWRDTRALFEQAARAVPDNYMAITMLGSLQAREGRLDEAMAKYREALQLQPLFPEAHFFLGNALDQKGQLDAAILEYEQALRFRPYLEQTHILLGVALGKQGKYEAAGAQLEAALQLNPESAVAHNNLARLDHAQGRLDAAVAHYQAALKLDPQLAQAHNNLGILWIQKGRPAEGVGELRRALALNPTNAESQFNLASGLNQLQQWDEAARWFAKTVGAGFNDANAHAQYALALTHLGQRRAALGQFAQALLLDQDFVEALDGLSWVLATAPEAELRNGVEAARMAARACELTQNRDPAKLKTLAAGQAEQGRFQEAIASLDRALRLVEAPAASETLREYQAMKLEFQAGKPWRVR